MHEFGKDGLVGKDLIDWYYRDNYGSDDGGDTSTGSEGKMTTEEIEEETEMKRQLVNVLRHMIKHDKSIMAIKSTVKGSKRIEDILLKKSNV